MVPKRVLLVEGKDDEHVLKHIFKNRKIPLLDEIKHLGSVDKLLENVPVSLRAGEYGDIFGVVIDADTDLDARWRALRDRLIRIGYTGIPEIPMMEGTIIDPPKSVLLPRVGIWIMPDNQTEGILEDFLRFLVPAESRLFDHVTSSVTAIPEGERRFSDIVESKVLIHTWLAWQKDPGNPYGTAITARFLDPDVAQVDILVNWLKQLFFM